VCLSTRSGLDLFLRAVAWPRGSEVLYSAFTIPDVVRILEEHSLVGVPVDLDAATLAPRVADLEAAWTHRTRGVLVAHLFGGRTDMRDVAALARRRGLTLIEDAAQALGPDEYRGAIGADVVLFSFGTIKTATALGGGVAFVSDGDVRESMRVLRRADPLQSRCAHALRVVKAVLLKGLSAPPVYGALVRVLRFLGVPHDRLLRAAVRGFAGRDLLAAVRRRPSAPLLALLRRRIMTYPAGRLERRARLGEALAERLAGHVELPGRAAPVRSHWVFPVLSPEPERIVRRLRAAGYDATRAASVTVVARDAEALPGCRRIDAQIVYLPFSPDLSESDVERIAEAFLD